MTDATARWALPLLYAGQAQKELFHNEALARIDMLLHGVALSADLATPPGAPGVGDCWIVAEDGTGAWEGKDGSIACWTEGGWRFVVPRAGLSVHVVDRGWGLVYDGDAWIDGAIRADGFYIDEVRVVRERQSAIAAPTGGTTTDTQARNAILSILGALRMHGLIES